MNFKRKLAVLAASAIAVISFSASAAYVTVQGSGAGPTYEAARSSAINLGTLYCTAAGGYIAGVWLDSFVNQTDFGWSVTVYNSGCFVPD
ncbi:hypothetical protein [Luteimonas abyssi]|uniref:hypothetical protein n=1 Tax=Luteimonas abyssi TaxID=1247514 RepID=UPI0012FC5BAD|nr:hypothetical protein [Luteimonas abyssi]